MRIHVKHATIPLNSKFFCYFNLSSINLLSCKTITPKYCQLDHSKTTFCTTVVLKNKSFHYIIYYFNYTSHQQTTCTDQCFLQIMGWNDLLIPKIDIKKITLKIITPNLRGNTFRRDILWHPDVFQQKKKYDLYWLPCWTAYSLQHGSQNYFLLVS